MSKKNRKNRKARSVLHSLKDLGENSRDTLSRLATTVKTDVPTLMIGSGATVKNEGYSPFAAKKPVSRLSRIAQKFIPFRQSPEWSAETTSHKMKHLAKQISKGNSGMKVRRSRLPLVAALLTMMLGGAGYYAYQNVSLPDVNVSQYLDAGKWLGLASGQLKPGAETRKTAVTQKDIDISNTVSSYEKPRTLSSYSSHSSSRSTKATSSKLGKSKAKLSKKAVADTKRFNKLSRTDKQKVWKAKLAKLKQETTSKKKTVAHKTGKSKARRK